MQKGRDKWFEAQGLEFLKSLFESHVYHLLAMLSWPSN